MKQQRHGFPLKYPKQRKDWEEEEEEKEEQPEVAEASIEAEFVKLPSFQKTSWGAWDLLARPTRLAAIKPVNPNLLQHCLTDTRHRLSVSMIEHLPAELQEIVLTQLELSIADIIGLGLTSTFMWQVVIQHVQLRYRKISAPWARQSIVCQGLYAQDRIPASFIEEPFVKEFFTYYPWVLRGQWVELQPPWGVWPSGMPRQYGLSPVRRLFWHAYATFCQAIGPRSEEKLWRLAFESQKTNSGIPESKLGVMKAGCSGLFPDAPVWVLHNLTTHELVYSRKSVHSNSESQLTWNSSIFDSVFDDLLLMHIRFTRKNEDTSVDQRGLWAGHKFDIVTLEYHQEMVDEHDWLDISEAIVKEFITLYKKAPGRGST